jgi:hypothetical protein
MSWNGIAGLLGIRWSSQRIMNWHMGMAAIRRTEDALEQIDGLVDIALSVGVTACPTVGS